MIEAAMNERGGILVRLYENDMTLANSWFFLVNG